MTKNSVILPGSCCGEPPVNDGCCLAELLCQAGSLASNAVNTWTSLLQSRPKLQELCGQFTCPFSGHNFNTNARKSRKCWGDISPLVDWPLAGFFNEARRFSPVQVSRPGRGFPRPRCYLQPTDQDMDVAISALVLVCVSYLALRLSSF